MCVISPLSLCLYIYISIYLYIYISIYLYTYISIYLYIYISIYLYIYIIYLYIYISIYLYICISVYLYIYIYLFIYLYYIICTTCRVHFLTLPYLYRSPCKPNVFLHTNRHTHPDSGVGWIGDCVLGCGFRVSGIGLNLGVSFCFSRFKARPTIQPRVVMSPAS